jgi:hypothetical protein
LKTLSAFGLSSRFKHFCSSMLTARQLRTHNRCLQRKAKTKVLKDDEFFGSVAKTPMKSDKAPSTTNTQPSQDEAPETVPDGTLKVEDQTVSEILSLMSAEQLQQTPSSSAEQATAQTHKTEIATTKSFNKFFDHSGYLKAPNVRDVPVL